MQEDEDHLISSSRKASRPAFDYDAMYEDDEEELESLENHGSVISHLISQVKIGMDLTKVVLPTFILERRSLLEMYADFFAHPDLFISIADQPTPESRFIQVVKWYLSAFHAGRKSSVAKKPYNPILEKYSSAAGRSRTSAAVAAAVITAVIVASVRIPNSRRAQS